MKIFIEHFCLGYLWRQPLWVEWRASSTSALTISLKLMSNSHHQEVVVDIAWGEQGPWSPSLSTTPSTPLIIPGTTGGSDDGNGNSMRTLLGSD